MSAETNKNKYISIQDAEPFRMLFTPQRDPGFPLSRGQNWSPFDVFFVFFSCNSIDSTVEIGRISPEIVCIIVRIAVIVRGGTGLALFHGLLLHGGLAS